MYIDCGLEISFLASFITCVSACVHVKNKEILMVDFYFFLLAHQWRLLSILLCVLQEKCGAFGETREMLHMTVAVQLC